MQAQDIRKNWIQFFSEKKKHLYLPSASLIPQNPTLLLTGAGMVPFVPYFLGQRNHQPLVLQVLKNACVSAEKTQP